jgi:hypothetical protein
MPDREFDQHVLSLTVCDATRVKPVSICFAVTVAAWTIAPLGSLTVPRMLPVICCPATFKLVSKSHQEQRQRLRATHAFPHSSSRIKIDFAKQLSRRRFENARENSPTD